MADGQQEVQKPPRESGRGWGVGWAMTRSVYVPVALALPWLILIMGNGDKNAAVLDAIRMVESGGRESPPDGDGGLAIGPYQIHEIYWRDAVAFDSALQDGTYQDCRDRDYAEAVVRAYMRRWVPDAWRRGDAEVIARTHNGGPQGSRRAATDRYWEKVRERLR